MTAHGHTDNFVSNQDKAGNLLAFAIQIQQVYGDMAKLTSILSQLLSS